MPIEFPARYQFDVVVFLSALLSSIAVAGAIYFVAFHAPRFSPTVGSWLNESARIAHVAFVLSIMTRWVTKSGYAYRMALISALFSLASTACVIGLGNEEAVVFCAFTMTSSIWIMVEIGSHFESIDCCILRADPMFAERRRNRSSGLLEILGSTDRDWNLHFTVVTDSSDDGTGHHRCSNADRVTAILKSCKVSDSISLADMRALLCISQQQHIGPRADS